MTSKSRAAQESLAGLEKASAPFETKLEEAWKFIGSESGHSRRPANQDAEPAVKYSAFHGREEWLLRWLLKNLQSPKDASPRQTPSSWNLLHHLIQSIPITNAAQILSERKFISTLRRTLEEAKGLIEDSLTTNQPIELDSESSSTTKSSKTTPSKKRKRTEEEDKVENRNLDKSLLPAISKAVNYISASAKTTSDAPDDSQNGAFSAEYMKTVLITTAEESAKILGSWLALYSKEVPISLTVTETLTSPFVEIWELHTAGSEDLMQFSLHCLQPLLAVLRKGSQGGSEGDRFLQLEQLVARYIMIPSRTANTENAESELLETLTKIPVILSSVHASILFDIAINSLQPTKFLRRRPQDHAWLQTAFTVLKDSMPPKRLTGNRQAIQRMLQSARDSKVSFELPILRSVTLQYALLGDSTDWNLLSTIIKLDANTLLIPNKEKDLTQEVFTRVTAACIEPTWSELYQIVTDVVITLMNEFSKARDLSGFIRHWYAQLVEFERRRKEAFLFSMSLFSAWEDDTLQSELAKLLEPSLTVQQIVQLLEWLSAEVKINPNAVCVILEAISGAIKREEVIDAVGLRIYHIMFDDKGPEKLDGRYQWRSWRLLSRMLEWTQENELEEIPQLWLEKKRPFDSLQGKTSVGGLLEIDAENTVSLETLEALRLSCTLYSTAEDGSQLKILAGKPLLNLLQRLAYDIKAFPHDLQSDQELGQEVCGSNLNTLYRGAGWMMWSFVRCVLVEYPQVLLLGSQLPGTIFREMLQSVFWIASSPNSSSSPWLQINPNAFSKLWVSALEDEFIVNCTDIISVMIDIMLISQTNMENPLIKSPSNNSFTVKSFLKMPLERFSRVDRERILKSWLPDSDDKKFKDMTYESTVLNEDVLSLKVKILKRPTFYEGMKFLDLVNLVEALSNSSAANILVLDLYKELAKSTLAHMTVNLDQSRNRAYIIEALDHLKQQIKAKKDKVKSKAKPDFATVVLLDVVLISLGAKVTVLNDLDIISKKKFAKLVDTSREFLQDQLGLLLQKPDKFVKAPEGDHKVLSLYSIIDALLAMAVDEQKATDFMSVADGFLGSLHRSHVLTPVKHAVVTKLKALVQSYADDTSMIQNSSSDGELASVITRQYLERRVKTFADKQEEDGKLEMLESIFEKQSSLSISNSQLYISRSIIASSADSRKHADEDNEEDLFDLSSTYAALCGQIWQSDGFRKFALIGEMMDMMLRTKGRAISQWNIDSTLGSISIVCSRNGPSLRPLRAGSIYLHLCRLLQAIFTSHRLKLQGHFHLVVQSLQALLRCLFTPLPHSTSKVTKIFAPPPWLSAPNHQLRAKHAEAFTRLITLICDPSVSSVTRSQHNNLTSATDKAKRMAGQHMQYLLTLYIKLQLDMKMLPEVREKMVPGIYAIFDTTTPELRRAISDSLDSSGRAVFGTLYRDYSRFGKWKGS